jgi:hypothetical protein
MPLFQYFGWVGSFLVVMLLAANWCFSAPIGRALYSDVPLDQKISIWIHTDRKWPERVVFDTTRSSLAPVATVDSEMNIAASETLDQAERRPCNAFAQMTPMPVTPGLRPRCSARTERDPSSIAKAWHEIARR